MTVIGLFVAIFIVVMIGWLAVYALGVLAPGHPSQVDNIIWFVVVIVVLAFVLNAFGLVGSGPMVPRLR